MTHSLPNAPHAPAPEGHNTSTPAVASRRALLRQYKDSGPLAGVFSLTNQVNGKVYIGGGLNVDGSMNRMRFELKMRSHRNKQLQQDWTAHGAEAFSFVVLDQIKERADPLFGYQAEFGTLLALWREDIPCHDKHGYNGRDSRDSRDGAPS